MENYINKKVANEGMPRGRPVGSAVRQNMINVLSEMGEAYGYALFKSYREIFPKVTLRLIYYHFRKGAELGEFQVSRVEKEQGDYSWGSTAEKIYFELGPQAVPVKDDRITKFFAKKKK